MLHTSWSSSRTAPGQMAQTQRSPDQEGRGAKYVTFDREYVGKSIKGQHKFCSILWSGKQMTLRMLPNRSKLNRSSPGGKRWDP
jgi:hypothetical protein